MSPFTHGCSGLIVGICACEVAPELTNQIGNFWFVTLSILAGQIPDLDLMFKYVAEKMGTRLNRDSLFHHRGIGHSIWFHILYSVIFPFLLVGNTSLEIYLLACLYIFIQISIHLVEDMLDGSSGIHYLSLLRKKPIKLFSLLNDVDDAILQWQKVTLDVKREFANRLKLRIVKEFMLNIPSISFLIAKSTGVL